ncbi:MAG: tetratricopeptide repeat protein [Bacteroidaceae bacterium]
MSKSAETSKDEIHYMIGNAYYKIGNWKEAIQHYLEACEINNNSPAREKLKMTYSILEFYNKDVYGQ